MDGANVAKWVMIAGLGLAAVGGLAWIAIRLGLPLGNLPGDIRIEGRGASFRFPVVTCLLLSVVLTILVNVVLRLLRR
jgi:hypothetical protein